MAAAGRGSTGRLLGLGFLFGAKDDGAVETAKKVGEGMDHLADATEKASGTTNGLIKFGNAINGLNFLQLDRIGDAMEGLADKAGVGPGGAANSIESFGVQFGKSFREATAGLGQYTDEVKKYRGAISGAAFNLEVDAGELTRTTAAFVKQGHAVEDYGLSIRSMAGSMQAGILSGDQLSNVLTSLSEGYDLGAKGAGRHLDKITALGEQFGVGKEAAQGLEAAISAADPVLAKFSNLKVEGVTESITRLALAAHQRVGGPFQDRMQDAIGVFNELAGAREQMGQLITGLSSDFPMLAKEIGIASGDVGASMETILKDPLTFAKNMHQLMSTMDQSDPRLQRLKLSLGNLPAGFNFLIQGGEESAKALDAAGKPITNFEGSFSRMAKRSSGAARTFQESMDLLQERYENRLNKMTSQTDAQVVRRQSKAWKRLGDTIDRMRKKGGPLGGLFQLALDIRRHGFIHGLIPAIDKLAATDGPLGKVGKKLAKTLPFFEGFGDLLVSGALGLGKLAIVLHLAKGPLRTFFGVLKNVTRFISPLGMLATIGLLVYQNWDKFRLVAIEIGEELKILGDEIATGLGFKDLDDAASQTWDNIKNGAKILWEDYLIPFGRWLYNNLPQAFGHLSGVAVGAIGFMTEASKALGIGLAAAVDIGIKGFKLMIALSPFKAILMGLQMLAEWAGKTDLGKRLGLDKAGEFLKGLNTELDPAVAIENLSRSFKFARKELNQVGQRMADVGRRAAEARLKTERGVMTAMAGPRMPDEEEETPTAKRRARRKKPRPQAKRLAATVPEPVPAGGGGYTTAGGTDLSSFFKGVESAVAKGAQKGTQQGVREGNKRSPRAAESGGTDRSF